MPIFSDKSIQDAVDKVDARDGNTLDVGVEVEGGKPALTFEAQGEHERWRVDLTWAGWAKSQLTKATTAVGAKIGVKW